MTSMLSSILVIILLLSFLFLLGCMIIFPIKDGLHYRKMIKYLKSNNLKDDLIFLKIIDRNNQPLPMSWNTRRVLRYLKRETNDNELRIIKKRYIKMFKKYSIAIIITMSIIFSLHYFMPGVITIPLPG